MPTLAELVGEDAARELVSQAHLELVALLERHRRARSEPPKGDDDKQDRGDQRRQGR